MHASEPFGLGRAGRAYGDECRFGCYQQQKGAPVLQMHLPEHQSEENNDEGGDWVQMFHGVLFAMQQLIVWIIP